MTFVSAVLAMGLLAGCGGGNQQGSKNTSGTSETSSQLSSGTVESKFTVNFYVDGAVYRTVTDVEKGSKLQAPTAPTKQQDDDFTYEFDGWYKSGATTAWNFETDVVNADLDLYAKFNQTVFTIKFNTNGGSEIEDKKVNLLETLVLPDNPTKEGGKFEGWFTDESLSNAFVPLLPICCP